jgi:hypothetical protein
MSSGNVLINDTVRIKVKFVDIDPATGEQEDVSPVSVFVIINNAAEVTVAYTSASQLTSFEYYYDFTPTEAGLYDIAFTGTLANSTQIVVKQKLYVSDLDADHYRPTITLRNSETIYFAPDLEPLYLDAEQLLAVFPDASLLEIGELIHLYSHEINQMYSITYLPGTEEDPIAQLSKFTTSTFSILEYIKAAVCCELSRTYGFGGDDELSVQIGDLRVTNKSMPRNNVTRANATTWCQMAAALRKEILTKKVGMRGVQPKGIPGKRISPTTVDPITGTAVYLSDTTYLSPVDIGEIVDSDNPDRRLKKYD